MAKRKRPDADAEAMMRMMTAHFICPCPECGCTDTTFDLESDGSSPFPNKMYINCPHCGRNTVVSGREDRRWRTERDGVLYIPDADNIAVTEYHRFDPSKYRSDEDAVRAEMELLDRCTMTYDKLSIEWEAEELGKRRAVLYGMAFILGMRDYVAGSILFAVSESVIVEDVSNIEDVIDRSIELIEGADLPELCMTLRSISSFMEREPKVSRLVERIKDDIMADIGRGADIDGLIHAFRALDEVRDPAAEEIIDTGFSKAEAIPDEHERNVKLAALYHASICGIGKCARLEEAAEFLCAHHDEFPWEFLDAAEQYGREMCGDPEKKERILELMDLAMEVIDDNECDYNGDINYDCSQVTYIRYRVSGNVKDLVNAAEFAYTSACISDDEDSRKLFIECLGDAKMPKRDRARMTKRAKSFGL